MMGIETPKMDSPLPNYMNMRELNKLLHFLEMSKGRFALRNHLIFRLLATTEM